jgi:hypothetical protein
MASYLESTSGGIEIGGNTTGSVTFEVTKDFIFSSGQCTIYWWQVVGSCILTTQVANINQCSTGIASCPKQMIYNIMGCNLVEVCNKITAKGYDIEIAEIWKFTLPALISEQNGVCGEYVQVYPGVDLPQNCLYDFIDDHEEWEMGFSIEWVAGGGLKFSGDEISYQMQGSDGIQLFGDGLSSEYLGLFDVEMSIDTEQVASIEPMFGNTIFPGSLTNSQDVVANNCNCGVIPVDLTLTHNLDGSDRLSSFLSRNNLVLPISFDLVYSVISYSWQANYHFHGIGNDGVSTELWNLVFEWACTDEVGSMVLDQLWTFGFYANIKNLNTGKKYDTRIMTAFDPIDVCSNSLFYGFKLNTVTKTIASAVTGNGLNVNADLNTCYDNIGLFAANDWLINPILTIDIWQNGTPTQQQYLNIQPLIPI